MAEKIIDISQLQQDDKNFNKHTEFGMSLLEKSVSKFGMGRSILIDKNNKIIAGNGITETAGSVGIERVKVIETDGKEIIAVKRNDIDLDTDEGREMALADNATNAANLKWDYDKIKAVEEEFNLKSEEWGVVEWNENDMHLSTQGRKGAEVYDEFVEKFQPKLTTDDCYTPPEVYKIVRDWVDKNITPLKGKKILRPFKPNGDYTAEDYSGDCIVLDNPPFSINAQILDFYLEREIPFFLFGNGLTLLGVQREGLTYIVIGEMIEFENGAKVVIGFYTNLTPELRIWCAGDLAEQIRQTQKGVEQLEKVKWDIHIRSAALLGKIAKRVTLKIKTDESEFINKLSDGTLIYGGG